MQSTTSSSTDESIFQAEEDFSNPIVGKFQNGHFAIRDDKIEMQLAQADNRFILTTSEHQAGEDRPYCHPITYPDFSKYSSYRD